jgi:glutaredoxin-dependent peroxiredoxin
MQIQSGIKAPDFTLYAHDKSAFTLSEQQGQNILILFFPLAFTSVCTAELCSVRDNMKKYESLHTKPFGISVDSLYTLNKYREDQQLNFPLLSDFNKEVSHLYGCIYPEFGFGMKGVSKRAAFVIDNKGTIQYAEVLENASEQPDFAAIQNVIAGLI